MEKSDVVVIGGGIAGLLCSIWAARRGRSVRLLTYGQGALTVAGGIIDLYGYAADGSEVAEPLKAIASLREPHPYAMVGAETVEAAVEAFLSLTAEAGYPYTGSARHNLKVPTSIGSFKNSCLAPRCLDGEVFAEAEHIIVVGFNLLKDYFPELIANGYRSFFAGEKSVGERRVKLAFAQGQGWRDVSALDVARELDKPEQVLNVAAQLKSSIKPNTVLVFPPVLGEKADYSVWQRLEQELHCRIVETSSMPPSVTGLRLDALLHACARSCGVDVIEKAHVIAAEVEDGRCLKVCTQNYGRRLYYAADQFILATGGVFGGGLKAGPGRMYEPIFNIEIAVPADQADWSYPQLFSGRAQPFAAYGIRVNHNLNPLGPDGTPLLTNVRVIGRQLAGYDFCFEKSGNGVAVATAYAAAAML